MDQSLSGPGIYNGGGIRDSIHLHLQWTQLAICPYPQLYEGANHVPLLKDKHLGILPQGKVERPCGQISQLEVHQLLSARLQVVYPVGLNGGNQSVTIDLPGPLHSGSSITTDEHPYIKIDILPLPLRSRTTQTCH